MLSVINGEIITCGSSGTIDKGAVKIKDGKILDIGNNREIKPEGRTIDASGMVITPGFIDAHTHVGIAPLETTTEIISNESTDVLNPHLRASDGIDPNDPGFKDLLEGGITTAMVHPGSPMSFGPLTEEIAIIAGQSCVLKTSGRMHHEVLREPAGLKMALGEHPKRFLREKDLSPQTRMGILGLLREYFTRARDFDEDISEDQDEKAKLRVLKNLLAGKFPARVHVHKVQDINTIIKMSNQFGFDLILEHVTEGHLVKEKIAREGIPCVIGPICFSKRGIELGKLSPRLPKTLFESGIKIALMTDHPTVPGQYLPLLAGLAVSERLPEGEALNAITINAAEILGVAKRVGSIEVKKDADLLVHDGNPLEPDTKIRTIIVDGKIIKNQLPEK